MDLLARVDAFPESWKPEPGDTLAGRVVEVDERDGGYGIYPVLTVATEDGREVSFHAFHTVAKRELARQKPEPGDEIAVKYFGRRGEATYESYRIAVDKAKPDPKSGPDWTAIQAEAEEELASGVAPSDKESDDNPWLPADSTS